MRRRRASTEVAVAFLLSWELAVEMAVTWSGKGSISELDLRCGTAGTMFDITSRGV